MGECEDEQSEGEETHVRALLRQAVEEGDYLAPVSSPPPQAGASNARVPSLLSGAPKIDEPCEPEPEPERVAERVAALEEDDDSEPEDPDMASEEEQPAVEHEPTAGVPTAVSLLDPPSAERQDPAPAHGGAEAVSQSNTPVLDEQLQQLMQQQMQSDWFDSCPEPEPEPEPERVAERVAEPVAASTHDDVVKFLAGVSLLQSFDSEELDTLAQSGAVAQPTSSLI